MADLSPILKKLRRYEIRIRKAVNSHLQGDFHSVFKGSGLEYDDIRSYQYGDDIRSIDWNASAKGHGTFVKTYREDKQQSVFFLLDVSASQQIGHQNQKKLEVAREICGVLALSATREGSEVGLIAYSDRKEKYIPAALGAKHAYYLVKQLYAMEPESKQTDLHGAIRYALNVIRRKSIIIMVSDFIDNGYQDSLKALAHQHDLVLIHVSTPTETRFPRLGIIPLHEKEKGKTVWINTSTGRFLGKIRHQFENSRKNLEDLAHRQQSSYLHVETHKDFVPDLVRLFRFRNHFGKGKTR